MKIQVLHTPGCENYPRAVDAVRDAIHMAGLNVEPDEVEISAQDEAERLHFLGSPSVHVDGVDVEPAARPRTDYNLG